MSWRERFIIAALVVAAALVVLSARVKCGGILAHAGTLTSKRRVVATSYTYMTGANARWNGDAFACGKNAKGQWGVYGGEFKRVLMNEGERGIAHRALRCGTLVELTYRCHKRHGCDGKLRRVLVPVVDRGPYWATPADCHPSWSTHCWKMGKSMIRLTVLWERPTHVDMTQVVARELKFPGKGWVTIRVVRRVLRRVTR